LTNLNSNVAISTQDVLSSCKDSIKPATKRRLSPFSDEFDAENVDPNELISKRSKGSDGTPHKPAKFSLVDAIPQSLSTPTNTPNNASSKHKQLFLSVPAPANKTSIAHSRGSPKHKRVGLLSKQRRFSSSPFRRVDPPAFNTGNSSTGLPFSIDAALSGTISSYKPAAVISTPQAVLPEPKSMPKSWFFDIHEDTVEEEAANMMEHSASTLDISSDDDCETRRKKDELERGKENIPPPDWVAYTRSSRLAHPAAPAPAHKGISRKAKIIAATQVLADAMQEDRAALGSLATEDFYPEGLDENSVEIVDPQPQQKPSALSKDTIFDFVAPQESPTKKVEAVAEEQTEVFVHPDSSEQATL
jgi:hypothetical protein